MNASKRRTDFELTDYCELWRPQYHFSTLDSRVNDPNGLVYYKGVYHLYYQCSPHFLRDENPRTADYVKRYRERYGLVGREAKHWGHATSRDLIHWEERELALFPDDVGHMWSGTAAVDENNTSGLFSGTEEKAGIVVAYSTNTQHIGIAYSTDGGESFQKVSTTEPILKNPGISAFRDPHIFWHEETKKWKMVVAGKTGKMWIYEASDLLHWSLCSTDDCINTECPNLFRMKVEGTGEEKWILSCVGRGYYVGSFDGYRFSAESEYLAMNEGPDAYAGITFSGLPEGRIVMISWFNGYDATADGKWNGAFSLPVEMKLIKKDGSYRLVQNPVEELASVKGERLLSLEKALCHDGEDPLAGIRSNCFDLSMEIDLARTEGDFTLAVCQGEGEEILISYEKDSHCMTLDRRRTQYGLPSFCAEAGVYNFFVDPATLHDGVLDLRLLVDISNLELFLNEGRYYFPMRIQPFTTSKGISLRHEGKLFLNKLTVNACKSIYFEEDEPIGAIHVGDDRKIVTKVGETVDGPRVCELLGREALCAVADERIAGAALEDGVLQVTGRAEGKTEVKLYCGEYHRFLEVEVTKEPCEREVPKKASVPPVYQLRQIARAVEEYSGRINVQKQGTGIPFTISDEERSDFSLSSQVTLYGKGIAGILFGVQSGKGFYCADLDASLGGVRLWKMADGVRTELAFAERTVAVNASHRLEIKVSGERIGLSLNGEALIDAPVGEIPAGKLGLNASVSDVAFAKIAFH